MNEENEQPDYCKDIHLDLDRRLGLLVSQLEKLILQVTRLVELEVLKLEIEHDRKE